MFFPSFQHQLLIYSHETSSKIHNAQQLGLLALSIYLYQYFLWRDIYEENNVSSADLWRTIRSRPIDLFVNFFKYSWGLCCREYNKVSEMTFRAGYNRPIALHVSKRVSVVWNYSRAFSHEFHSVFSRIWKILLSF